MTTGIFVNSGATEEELLALRTAINAALLSMAADGSITVTTAWGMGDKSETLRVIKDPEAILDEIAYALNVIDADTYPFPVGGTSTTVFALPGSNRVCRPLCP